jgi:hypothetical protein
MKRRSFRLLLVGILLSCLVLVNLGAPPVASAEEEEGPEIGAMIAEGPIRILAGVRLIAGCVLLIPSAVLAAVPSALDQDLRPLEETFQLHVGEPWEYLVERPLGVDLAGV